MTQEASVNGPGSQAGYGGRSPDLGRLASAMQKARLTLRRYRSERREAVREFIGGHWSEEGPGERVPVNLLALYVRIISRMLIAKNPRLMISTTKREGRAVASAMESWANQQIDKMDLANTLKRVVLDGLFSVGITKVGLTTPAEAVGGGYALPAGSPFACRVDLDDFVFDVHARDFREAAFIGHRFRVPLEAVKESAFYAEWRKDLAPSSDSPYNLEGDERLNVLGRSHYANGDEFEDMVDLWEIYLPRTRQILTLADESISGGTSASGVAEPLRVQEWLGPDCGPYHILGFDWVPGNAMPKAPIQDLIDLHKSINHIYRKLIRQAERQKSNIGVRGGRTEDGQRLREASDGDIFQCDNPEDLKPIESGGPNQGNFLLGQHLIDRFDFLAGNLSIMGGLAAQSKTATQDTMLNKNSSVTISDMQDTVINHVAAVARSLLWYWHHNPFSVMETTWNPPGLPQYAITRRVTPEQRASTAYDSLDLKVDPYSMQHTTPQQRAASLNQVMTQIVMPMLPILQQQGIGVDLSAYLEKIAGYMDMPDLPEIVQIRESPVAESPNAGQDSGSGSLLGGGQPHEYIRRSVGADSPGNRNANLISALMSGQNGSSNGTIGANGSP